MKREDDQESGWPPLPDPTNSHTQSLDGRTIERFTHGGRHFFLTHPKTKTSRKSPLLVVLHSANRTAFDYLGYHFLNRKVDPDDNPSDINEKAPADFYVLFLDSNNEEWWGWTQAQSDPGRYANEPTSTENRVLDTIDWVAKTSDIDRNRIYLNGISMGGCGSLGIGLPHGDIFAAIRVWVPAGTGYAACRMGWHKGISGIGQADPPVVVDLSSQIDNWSKDQDVLLNAAREHRLPLVVGWGPFGHVGKFSLVAKYPPCAAALALPWMEIRKNEAYPVFTDASSDGRDPWRNKSGEFDESGQINGYFRWKSLTDTPSLFAMRLWLENSEKDVPRESTADVAFRRLQQFKIEAGVSYAWQIVHNGNKLAVGVATPDATGLLTIPRMTITTEPCTIEIKKP